MPFRLRKPRETGFTFVELMVTLAVLAILVRAALPAFDRLLSTTRVAAWTTTYTQALHTMRHMAVETGRHVTLCELDANNRCTGRWGAHLVLFFDDRRAGRLASPEDLIVTVSMPGEDARLNVSWKGFGEKRFLNVRSTGAFRQNGRFRLCPEAGVRDRTGREIVLNVTGRMRVARYRCP